MDASTDYPLYYSNYSYDYEDEMFNFSLDCPPSALPGSNVFIPLVYFLIFFTGFSGNLLVLVVVGGGWRGPRRGGRLVDTFILNLALADLVFVLTLPLWAVSAGRDGRWDFGRASDPLCKLSSYVIAVNRLSNVAFLTCMSVDRYLAVVKLLDSRRLRSGLCVRSTCGAVWGASLLLGVPSLLQREAKLFQDQLYCTESHGSPLSLGLGLATTLLTFVLPLSVILLCYGTIVLHLSGHQGAARANARAQARRRHSVKMVLSIIAAFVVSWLPFNVFKVLEIVRQMRGVELSCAARSWQRNGLILSCCLAFFNSCVNPAIYFVLDHQFRRQAQVMCRGCAGKPESQQKLNSSVSCTMGTSENSGRT